MSIIKDSVRWSKGTALAVTQKLNDYPQEGDWVPFQKIISGGMSLRPIP